MVKALTLYEGVIRPGLVSELESFRVPGRRASSYFLNLNTGADDRDRTRLSLKNNLSKERERIDQLDVPRALRNSLRRDWEQAERLANSVIGERHTFGLACFVASDSGYGRALGLPWPVRNRAFLEERFVLWPLRQVLEQAERYAIILTNKTEARLFLFYFEQIEEIEDMADIVPGRIRFPDPFRESHYMHKHVEHFHHHFEKVADEGLRLYDRERFEHVIVGGHWETLPQFESRLHRYLRDRIIARWDIDVHTATPKIWELALQEEQKFLKRQAQDIWRNIQEQRSQRGALGPEEVFAALWQRRVQALLEERGKPRPGFHCSTCGRLHLSGGRCVECGGNMTEVPDIHEEAVHEAVEQSAQVRYWDDPALKKVESVAALKRF